MPYPEMTDDELQAEAELARGSPLTEASHSRKIPGVLLMFVLPFALGLYSREVGDALDIPADTAVVIGMWLLILATGVWAANVGQDYGYVKARRSSAEQAAERSEGWELLHRLSKQIARTGQPTARDLLVARGLDPAAVTRADVLAMLDQMEQEEEAGE